MQITTIYYTFNIRYWIHNKICTYIFFGNLSGKKKKTRKKTICVNLTFLPRTLASCRGRRETRRAYVRTVHRPSCCDRRRLLSLCRGGERFFFFFIVRSEIALSTGSLILGTNVRRTERSVSEVSTRITAVRLNPVRETALRDNTTPRGNSQRVLCMSFRSNTRPVHVMWTCGHVFTEYFVAHTRTEHTRITSRARVRHDLTSVDVSMSCRDEVTDFAMKTKIYA